MADEQAQEQQAQQQETAAAAQQQDQAGTQKKRRLKKAFEGVVVSNRMQKSVIVRVERQFRHPVYHKIVRTSKKYMAHDEDNKCRVGDRVLIRETRPLSKRKCWRVISIVSSPQQ